MRRFLSFILGLIFGIVFLLGTFGLAMYTSVTTVHPNEIYADLEKYLGDLGDVSLLQAYYNILKLYNDNTGGLTDGDNLYSVGKFLADNHISTTNEETGEVTAFGIVMPKALLDAPLFEYFNNNVDENGHTGVQRALKQIKLSAVPSVVNMFTPAEGEKFISDEVTTELDNYSVFDLVYGENTAEGEAPNIVANLATITKNIKLVHLIPSLHTEEETENLIKTVLSAVGEASIGELITDLTSNNNIFGMLNADGSLREVGKLTFADILGENDPLISSMLGSISISDFIADNGNINITQALDKVSISGLFGLIKRPAEVEGATVVHYYKTAEEGAETYVWSVGEKDGKYYVSVNADNADVDTTWYYGKRVCEDTSADHTHGYACFDYLWYKACEDGCEDATHVHVTIGESEKKYVAVENTSLYRTIANLKMSCLFDAEGAFDFDNFIKQFDGHTLDTIIKELLADNEILNKVSTLLKLDDMTLSQLLADGGFDDLISRVTDVPINDILKTFEVPDMEFITDIVGEMTIRELVDGGFEDISIGGLLKLIKRETSVDSTFTIANFTATAEEGETVVELSVATKVDGEQTIYCLSTNYNKDADTTAEDYVAPTWYEGQLDCKDDTHTAFEHHTKGCFEYVLYQECNETHDHEHYDDVLIPQEQEDGTIIHVWHVKANALYNTLGNMTIGSIVNDGFSPLFDELMDMKLGDLMDVLDNGSETAGIMDALKNYSISELIDGTYEALKLGEVLEYARIENTGDLDESSKKEHKDADDNVVGYTATIGGQLVVSADGKTWYNGKLACKVDEHTCDESCEVDCSKAHTHDFDCYNYLWYQECKKADCSHATHIAIGDKDNYAEATGLLGAIAELTIADLTGGGDIMSPILDKLTLGDVMKNGMPSMLESLKDTPISQLNGAIKTVKVGDFVGFKRSEVDVADWTLVKTDVYQKDDTFAKKEGDKHYLAELTCEDATHAHTVDCYTCIWYAKDGVTPLSGVEKALADKVIDDLSDFKTILNDLTLGEVLSPVPDILKSIADTPINKLNTAIEGLYVGELLEYKREEVEIADWTVVSGIEGLYQHADGRYAKADGEKYYVVELTCNESYAHAIDCYDFVWLKKVGETSTPVTGIEKVLAGKTINELKDLNSILNDVTLGDVMQDNLPPMLKSLKDVKIGELGTKMNDLCVGELLGYKKDADVWYKECPESCGHGDSEHTNIDGKYYVETTGIEKVLASKTINELKDLNSILNDVTLGDVMQDNLPPMLKSLKDVKIGELSTEITKTKVGNLLEFTYDDENSCWKKDDGTGVLVELTGIEKVLADKSISELKNLNTILNDVTLGDVMQDNLPDMLESLADTPISGLNSALDGLYVGEMLKYTRTLTCTEDHDHTDDCYKWVNGDADVDGMMAKIANKKVGNLGNIGDDIQSYTIVDVLGKKDTDSALIKALYDTPVGEIGSTMDNIQLGTAMGYYRNPITCTITSEGHAHSDDCSYEKADGKFVWYKKCEESGCTHSHVTIDGNNCVKVGAPQSAFVNSTLSGIGDDISHVKLGELLNIDDESSSMLQALKDTPIDGIGNAINTMALGTSMGFVRREIDTTTGYADIDTITTVKTNGTIIAKVLGDTWYEAVFNCKDTTHAHTADCYNYVWYEKCTANEHEHTAECGGTEGGCTTTAHKHDMTIGETNYDKVGGLNAKMANLTVESMNSNAFVQIVEDLSMRDLIDSGVLTFSDEDKYKLAIMSGCGCTDCTLAGYIVYKTTPSLSSATAEEYFRSCHSGMNDTELVEHRDKWQDCTLNDFINALLKGI